LDNNNLTTHLKTHEVELGKRMVRKDENNKINTPLIKVSRRVEKIIRKDF
jgi:hypothetical protein